MSAVRAKPEMVHCVLAVKHVELPTVINTPLMPVLVKVTDRVVAALAARKTVSDVLVELVMNSADVLVVYPVADPVSV